MNAFHCDICGKLTYINPPTQVELDANGHIVTTTIKRQNIYTGEIENIEIPKMIELKPKAILIHLSAGDETVRRDFCRECYNASSIKVKTNALWVELEKTKSID